MQGWKNVSKHELEKCSRLAAQLLRPTLSIACIGKTLFPPPESFRSLNFLKIRVTSSLSDYHSIFSRAEIEIIMCTDLADDVIEIAPMIRAARYHRLPVLLVCSPESESTQGHLEETFLAEGMSITSRLCLESSALIYLILPIEGSRVEVRRERGVNDLGHAASGERPIIAVCGFMGRGNCGDEALFQSIYETFSDEYEIIPCVEEHGAYPGWWDWYPYRQCNRINQTNIHFFERRIAGLIVGGGGLGIGFGAGQVHVARRAGTPVAFAGTDHVHNYENVSPRYAEGGRDYLRLFDLVALRSEFNVEVAKKDSVNALYGADWAFNLKSDKSSESGKHSERAMIVLREFPPSSVDFYYIIQIRKLIEGLKNQGFDPTFLPFSPEDVRFLEQLQLTDLAPTETHWWNPRRVQELIAASGLVVSVGRLHSMIFALNVATPVVQLVPPLWEGIDPNRFHKVRRMADEFRISYIPSVDELLEMIAGQNIQFTDRTMAVVNETRERLHAMVGSLRDLFRY